ncbi:dTMP kinase [Mycoplasmoides alvi]|uniref:dTMP kinase n=1 Tax=Mycoplasmoides alvi TaxID=78580 RepID=UPI00051BD0FA|nr:dTMP kinase [Mycoplasmoides alvi]
MKDQKGLFISFEGTDGSGKTTVIQIIEKKIKEEFSSINLMVIREPGGTEISEKIRKLLLLQDNKMEPITEVFLFAASRAELFSKNSSAIQHLNKNNLLLTDRFVDSSIVYQNAKNIDKQIIIDINKYAINGLCPDITFFLLLSPEMAIKRMNSKQKNRLDDVEVNFQNKIYELYKQRIDEINSNKQTKQKAISIDASQPIAQVTNTIWFELKKIIENHYK